MTIRMDQLAGSGKDEFYTPAYAVRPIVKYLDPGANIWCPFDSEDSQFVKILRHHGHNVYATHKWAGQDFFDMPTPSGADYIISNPPYSMKTEVLGSLFDRGVPFAMLLGVVGLFESKKRFEMFRDNKWEVMYFDKRISYFESYTDPKPALNPPFSSVYVTSGVLPDRIVFESVDKNDYLHVC